MRTVGEIFQQARQEKGDDVADLAKELKVKKDYLLALEADNYHQIPGGMPIISGIVTNYAQILDLDPVKMGAIFRRDYAADPGAILPEEFDQKPKTWTPTHTVSLVVLLLVVLAGFFYYSRSFLLSGPPVINLTSPKEGEVVKSMTVSVSGKIKRGDVAAVNGEKVLLDEDNNFSFTLDCQEGSNLVLVEATNPDGESSQLTREFVCQPD